VHSKRSKSAGLKSDHHRSGKAQLPFEGEGKHEACSGAGRASPAPTG
jgi:hypothetical protein